MPTATRRGATVLLAAGGLALAALALAHDVLTHAPRDFGLSQSLTLLAGLLLLLEAGLRWRTGTGIAAALDDEHPRGDAVALAIAGMLAILLVHEFRHYLVDDSYITFRYARNLVTGHGLRWNPGDLPVEGFSNLLWMLLAAAALRFGFDPLLTARVVSAACLAVSLPVVGSLARALSGSRRAGRYATMVFAATPSFAFWAMSGLETMSVVLLALLYFRACARELESGAAPNGSAACAVLLAVSRPEGVALVAVSLVPVALARRTTWLRALAARAAPAIALLLLWKSWEFGTVLTNTLAAKTRPFAGLPTTLAFFAFTGPLVLWWAARAARGRASLTEQQIMVCAAAWALASLHVVAAVAHYHRLFLPLLAPMLACAGIALAELTQSMRAAADAPPRPALAHASAAIAAFAVLWTLTPLPAMKIYAGHEVEGLAHEPLGRFLDSSYRGAGLLAASDCGIVPYLSHMATIDLCGLNDPHLARGFDAAYVMSRVPDVFVLHSNAPDRFEGRADFDRALQPVVARDPRYHLVGCWPFYGYWMWVYADRPVAAPPPPTFRDAAVPPIPGF